MMNVCEIRFHCFLLHCTSQYIVLSIFMKDEVKFETLALNVQFYMNVFHEASIWIEDVYAVFTRIILLHVCDLQCPVVDEKLCPVS